MKSFYFDQELGDVKFNELHDVEEITGKMELEQALWLRLKTNQGEWMFDVNFGVPWMELFSKKASPKEFRTEIRKTIYQEERVINVIDISVDFDIDNRKLSVYFEAETTEGLIKSNGEVEA